MDCCGKMKECEGEVEQEEVGLLSARLIGGVDGCWDLFLDTMEFCATRPSCCCCCPPMYQQ